MSVFRIMMIRASLSAATCRRDLLQVRNNLAAALMKMMAISARVVAVTVSRVTVTTRFEELRLSVEQCFGFAFK